MFKVLVFCQKLGQYVYLLTMVVIYKNSLTYQIEIF